MGIQKALWITLTAAVALAAATLITADRALAQPANDNFADRVVITSLPFSDSFSTLDATIEPGEPLLCPFPNGSTVWYEFTPSTMVFLQANTHGSGYDTTLAIYTGDPFAPTFPLACDDDSGPGLTSQIQATAPAGVTVYLQVGGFLGEQGSLNIRVVEPEGPPGGPFCADGLDSDADGAVDEADSGCQEVEGPAVTGSCFDGIDNDNDGVLDGQDTDCNPIPEGPPGNPNCEDGLDNDFDFAVDDADSGCQALKAHSRPNHASMALTTMGTDWSTSSKTPTAPSRLKALPEIPTAMTASITTSMAAPTVQTQGVTQRRGRHSPTRASTRLTTTTTDLSTSKIPTASRRWKALPEIPPAKTR